MHLHAVQVFAGFLAAQTAEALTRPTCCRSVLQLQQMLRGETVGQLLAKLQKALEIGNASFD
jgi:hypothetical protein